MGGGIWKREGVRRGKGERKEKENEGMEEREEEGKRERR